MSDKIEVAVVVELSAGNGTECSDVHTLEVPVKILLAYIAGNEDAFINYADAELETWQMAVDHASSYGIEQGEYGFYGEGEEEGDAEEPYAVVHGIYVPEVHDGYCCGGGTFITEVGVQKAYDNYEAFKKTL
jgi:hypothetical protein